MYCRYCVIPYSLVENLKATDEQIRFYCQLYSLVEECGYCRTSNEELSEKFNKSLEFVDSCLTNLKEIGEIVIEGGKKCRKIWLKEAWINAHVENKNAGMLRILRKNIAKSLEARRKKSP